MGSSRGASMAESLEERFRRLLTMVPYIVKHPGVSVRDIRSRFGITRSQLVADLNLLFVCGLPGYGPGDLIEAFVDGSRVWIRLADYFARPLRLSAAEGLLLYSGARALSSSGAGDEALDRAIKALEQALGPDVLSRVSVELEGAGELATVREGLLTKRRLHLVYYAHFKCNLKRLRDHPHLWRFTRQMYQHPGIRPTCHLDDIKTHYYWSQPTVNPTRIVPRGPSLEAELARPV